MTPAQDQAAAELGEAMFRTILSVLESVEPGWENKTNFADIWRENLANAVICYRAKVRSRGLPWLVPEFCNSMPYGY